MKLKFLTWKGPKVRRRPFIVNAPSVNAYIAARFDVVNLGVELVEDDPDFFVVINRVDEDVLLPRDRTIGVVTEPTWSPNFRPGYLERRCQYILTHDVSPFKRATQGQCLCIPWVTREETQIQLPKTKKLSIIVAPTLHQAEGTLYSFRHRLVKQILGSDLECDIYGDWPGDDRRLKGFLPSKAAGLLRYEFSVAIENCSEPGYSSEKLVDCFLSGTQPVYAGDPTVSRYIDPQASVMLDTSNPMSTLRKIVRGEIQPNLESIYRTKRQYENEGNLLAQVRNVLNRP